MVRFRFNILPPTNGTASIILALGTRHSQSDNRASCTSRSKQVSIPRSRKYHRQRRFQSQRAKKDEGGKDRTPMCSRTTTIGEQDPGRALACDQQARPRESRVLQRRSSLFINRRITPRSHRLADTRYACVHCEEHRETHKSNSRGLYLAEHLLSKPSKAVTSKTRTRRTGSFGIGSSSLVGTKTRQVNRWRREQSAP